MFNLIRNENMKIYKRIRTWIMMIILVGLTLVGAILMHSDQKNPNTDWKQSVQMSIEHQKQTLEDPNLPKAVKEQFETDMKENQYRLEHNVHPIEGTMWGAVDDLSSLIKLITIFTVIVAADSVAGEFGTGTIKLLLIRPVSRSKILLSKYISSFLFTLLLLLLLLVASVLFSGLIFGFGDIGIPYLHMDNGQVVEGNVLIHVLQTYGLACIQLIMIVTLAFMISTVFRSSSLAIGLSIFIMFVGSLITMFLRQYDWGKYWLFANTDLTQYLRGTPLYKGTSIGFSLAVLLVYFVIFNALAWTIFRKRDVAA